MKGQMLSYLTSITIEKDPEKRELKLKEYAKQVENEFLKSPIPKNWERKA